MDYDDTGKGKARPVSPREEDRDLRSLDDFTRRNLRYPFFEAFLADAPLSDFCLALLNLNEFAHVD